MKYLKQGWTHSELNLNLVGTNSRFNSLIGLGWHPTAKVKKMETEGLGGPCPRCDSMDCLIKKGTGTWYTFIACTDCYFAYGENAGDMREETGGIVAGAEVWKRVITRFEFESFEEFEEFSDTDEEDSHRIESPFTFKEQPDWVENLCVSTEGTIAGLIKAYNAVREDD